MSKTERALIQRSEEAQRLALVAERASDSVLIMDENLIITWVTQSSAKSPGFRQRSQLAKIPEIF